MVAVLNPYHRSRKHKPQRFAHRPLLFAGCTIQRLSRQGRNNTFTGMEKPQHADAHLFLLSVHGAGAQQQQSRNNPEVFHLDGAPLLSTSASMRPAKPAAMKPGLPCTLTSNTARGCSAGAITTANPSPGAFFACVHSAVPVLANADSPGLSAATTLPVPFCAERASPCSTGRTSLSSL